jgi:hypothetical protein
MNTSTLRRTLSCSAIVTLLLVLTACTGTGGGQLPPSAGFSGAASFGFDFSCEDKGGLNPPTGQLRIQLAYTDKGTSPIGSSFGIHGVVDTIDPVVESAICIGKNPPPPPPGTLIFLGRYRLTTTPPSGFPTTCPTQQTQTAPLCRFEVIVQDNDRNLAPSPGDFFSIKLSKATVATSALDVATVFYTRAGYLASGNLTVK